MQRAKKRRLFLDILVLFQAERTVRTDIFEEIMINYVPTTTSEGFAHVQKMGPQTSLSCGKIKCCPFCL